MEHQQPSPACNLPGVVQEYSTRYRGPSRDQYRVADPVQPVPSRGDGEHTGWLALDRVRPALHAGKARSIWMTAVPEMLCMNEQYPKCLHDWRHAEGQVGAEAPYHDPSACSAPRLI